MNDTSQQLQPLAAAPLPESAAAPFRSLWLVLGAFVDWASCTVSQVTTFAYDVISTGYAPTTTTASIITADGVSSAWRTLGLVAYGNVSQPPHATATGVGGYDYDASPAFTVDQAFDEDCKGPSLTLTTKYETGLWYFRARYFDSELGRFISRDPIGYEDGMNMYQYVGSQALNFGDYMGLAADHSYHEISTALIAAMKACGKCSLLSSTRLKDYLNYYADDSGVSVTAAQATALKAKVSTLSTLFRGFQNLTSTADKLSYLARHDPDLHNIVQGFGNIQDGLTAVTSFLKGVKDIASISTAASSGDPMQVILEGAAYFNNVPGIGAYLGFTASAYTAMTGAIANLRYSSDVMNHINNIKGICDGGGDPAGELDFIELERMLGLDDAWQWPGE